MVIDVEEISPLGTRDEWRLAADGAERPRRTIHAAGDHAIGAHEGIMALRKAEFGLGKGGCRGIHRLRLDVANCTYAGEKRLGGPGFFHQPVLTPGLEKPIEQPFHSVEIGNTSIITVIAGSIEPRMSGGDQP